MKYWNDSFLLIPERKFDTPSFFWNLFCNSRWAAPPPLPRSGPHNFDIISDFRKDNKSPLCSNDLPILYISPYGLRYLDISPIKVNLFLELEIISF